MSATPVLREQHTQTILDLAQCPRDKRNDDWCDEWGYALYDWINDSQEWRQVAEYISKKARQYLVEYPDVDQDIQQDVLIELMNSILDEHYDPSRGPLVPYAIGIAKNLIRHYCRMAGRDRKNRLSFEDETRDPRDSNGNPEYIVDEHQEEDARVKMVDRVQKIVRPNDRELLQMTYFEEKSGKEIAAKLGLEETCVRQRLSRARKLIRRSLGLPT